MAEKNIFQKIIDREIAAKILYEDEHCLAFPDINPQAPVHALIIPKRAIRSVAEAADADAETLGRLLVAARKLAEQLNIKRGYRLVVNCGADAGQTVDHLHVHLLAGRPLSWPPG